MTNWTASILEDIAVIAGLWAALHHPIVFLVALGAFILLMIWLLPKIWRALRAVYRKLQSLFGGKPAAAQENPAQGTAGTVNTPAEASFSLSLKSEGPDK